MTTKQNLELDSKSLEAIQHQNEIERTRVGGFGGSDAKMFYKIGMRGLSALSNSDKKRIRVAKGIDEYKPVFQTEAMRKGHEFEDWYWENHLSEKGRELYQREVKICGFGARNFGTFAHADLYYTQSKIVEELKFLQYPNTAAAEAQYMAQLQWYYMLGVKKVRLIVGDSNDYDLMKGEHSGVNVNTVVIARNEEFIETLRAGIKLLDDNWDYLNLELPEEWTSEDLLPFEATEVELMTNYLQEIKKLEALVEEKKNNLLHFMQDNGVKSINSENYIITHVPAGTTSRFNKAKLLKDFPEIDESKYTTVSERKGYVTIKLK
jgi:hypothetical protein